MFCFMHMRDKVGDGTKMGIAINANMICMDEGANTK